MSDIARVGVRNGIEEVFDQWVERELAPWEDDESAEKEQLIEALTTLQDALCDYVNNLD